jgi:hypothetical protein
MSLKSNDLQVPQSVDVNISLDFYGFGPRTRCMHFIEGTTVSHIVKQFCREHKVPASHQRTLLFLAHDIVQEMYLSFGKSCIEDAEKEWKEDQMRGESQSSSSSSSSVLPLYQRDDEFETLLNRNIASKKTEEDFLMKWGEIVRDPVDRIRIAAVCLFSFCTIPYEII